MAAAGLAALSALNALNAIGAAGCGGPQTSAVGFSGPRAVERGARVLDAGGGAEASPVPKDFRSTFTKLGDRFLSEGHGRRYQAVLWLDATARAAWAALPAEMPEGARIVEEAIDADRAGERPAGLWVMEKRGHAWRFLAVGPDGQVAPEARVAACAECHREAPHDDLFVEVTPEGR